MQHIKTVKLETTGEVVELCRQLGNEMLIRRPSQINDLSKPTQEWVPLIQDFETYDIIHSIEDIETTIIDRYNTFPIYSHLKFVEVDSEDMHECNYKVEIPKIVNGFHNSTYVHYLVFGIRFVDSNIFDGDDPESSGVEHCRQNPWVVYLYGCDDQHYYKRFESKIKAFNCLMEIPCKLTDSSKYLKDRHFLSNN
jgi:hypothetical protein